MDSRLRGNGERGGRRSTLRQAQGEWFRGWLRVSGRRNWIPAFAGMTGGCRGKGQERMDSRLRGNGERGGRRSTLRQAQGEWFGGWLRVSGGLDSGFRRNDEGGCRGKGFASATRFFDCAALRMTCGRSGGHQGRFLKRSMYWELGSSHRRREGEAGVPDEVNHLIGVDAFFKGRAVLRLDSVPFQGRNTSRKA